MSYKENFTNKILIFFTVVLFAVGFLLSLLGSILAKVSMWAIFLRAFLSGIFMAVLAMVIYFVLDAMIPEFRAIISSLNTNSQIKKDSKKTTAQDSEETFYPNFDDEADDSFLDDDVSEFPSKETIRIAQKQKKVADDEILVEGVTLKNNTGVMAEAVRHVLDQDSD